MIFIKDPEVAHAARGDAAQEVFGSFASYLELLQDWLAYKTAKSDVHFFDWLGQHAKLVPREYYDALGR